MGTWFFQKKLPQGDINRIIVLLFANKMITESNNRLTYEFLARATSARYPVPAESLVRRVGGRSQPAGTDDPGIDINSYPDAYSISIHSGMSVMRKAPRGTAHQRVIVTLPQPIAAQLRKYAAVFRKGNKSGFVADAIQAHVERLKKLRHTARLRESYAAAADLSLAVAEEWKSVDEEAWRRLDRLEAKSRKG